jgi:hypothetical protein
LHGVARQVVRRQSAVFAVVTADGAVLQIHVEQGIDGLAPAGTITALGDPATAPRVGVVFNWAPDQILFITDPRANAIVTLKLVPDGRIFRVEATRRLTPAGLSTPVDLAPAVPGLIWLLQQYEPGRQRRPPSPTRRWDNYAAAAGRDRRRHALGDAARR